MKRIEEIYWLRFYGCLAVFAFHLLDRLNQHVDNVYVDLARIPTVLGTPIFIFISIFLFAARYGSQPPDGFLNKRLQYVMVPYLVYGLIYSTTNFLSLRQEGIDIGFWENLVFYLVYAGWHGYFLIIAMQFYAFYWLYARYGLERWLKPGPWLVIGSLIGMAYWGLTRLYGIEPPGYLLWIAPLGWIYLFFLAMLVVRYYAQLDPPRLDEVPVLKRLSQPRYLAAFVGLIALLTLPGWLEYSSKETWVVPLFILFTLCAVTRLRHRSAPPLVKYVNQYSFGIYLAHPMFFAMVDAVNAILVMPMLVYTALLIVAGLAGSIWLNQLANHTRWGGMLFGKRLFVPGIRQTPAGQLR
ncbi:acyltransferase family protein [Halomonas chromatireducens]|uniref:Putative poly-beta-1,6-N-acetyl-D-glucosamine export protein n=1 Tax=Halomonas chromatireducens TaxID=507626 RepID=A0A0X8HB52_9GAMM|nr:acyltransferase family protein [Halomonas chromatireducens]AMC99401.1 putative poly-beta-1,6-N-acetyl-D-glucosamine export protein [Halomonas chromatireducens]